MVWFNWNAATVSADQKLLMWLGRRTERSVRLQWFSAWRPPANSVTGLNESEHWTINRTTVDCLSVLGGLWTVAHVHGVGTLSCWHLVVWWSQHEICLELPLTAVLHDRPRLPDSNWIVLARVSSTDGGPSRRTERIHHREPGAGGGLAQVRPKQVYVLNRTSMDPWIIVLQSRWCPNKFGSGKFTLYGL